MDTNTYEYFYQKNWNTFLEELDTKSRATPPGFQQKIHRASYHAIRMTIRTIQTVANAIFFSYNKIKGALEYTAIQIKRVCILFLNMPLNIKKILFPSTADILEKKIESFTYLLEKDSHTGSTLKEIKKLPHDEKKELMLGWLEKSLGEAIQKPTIQTLYKNMKLLAEGDLPIEDLTKLRETTSEISKEKATNSRFPHISQAVEIFIQAFEVERIYENSITPSSVQKNFKILLENPNLLKRSEIAKLVVEAPSSLRSAIEEKKTRVQQRFIQCIHQQELHFLKQLPSLLKQLSLQEVQQNYLSKEEDIYLTRRINLVNNQIESLNEDDTTEISFKKCVPLFEKTHLIQQQEKKEKAASVCREISENIISQAKETVYQSSLMVFKPIKKRVDLIFEMLPQTANYKLEKTKILKDIESIEKKLNPSKSLSSVFPSIHKIIDEIQDLEKKLIRDEVLTISHVDSVKTILIEYRGFIENESKVQQGSSPWKDLAEIDTVSKRNHDRKSGFAKDVLCLILEKIPSCQLPLLLAKQDARNLFNRKENHPTPTTGVEKELEDAAKAFISSLQKKHSPHIEAILSSFTEFAAGLEKEKDLEIIQEVKEAEEQKANEPDFTDLAAKLDITTELNTWHTNLQEIWIQHISEDHKEKIKAAKSASAMQKTMLECFSIWLQKTTGHNPKKLPSLEEIVFSSSEAKRNSALKKLATHAKFKEGLLSYLQTIRTNLSSEHAQKKTQAPSKGFSLELSCNPPREIASGAWGFEESHFDKDIGNGIVANFENIISSLKAIRDRLSTEGFTSEFDFELAWIKSLDRNPRLKSNKSISWITLSICQKAAASHFASNTPTPPEILEIFLNQYKNLEGKFALETLTNSGRSSFLKTLLLMVFSEDRNVEVTYKQRSYAIQLLSLSDLPLADIEKIKSKLVPTSSDPKSPATAILQEVGAALQKTSISLEGVEESTLQKSFQRAGLAKSSETRALLDIYRARAGESLSLHLMTYLEGLSLSHDEQRELAERALCRAYSFNPEETRSYLISKTPQGGSFGSVDLKTLATPLEVFFSDVVAKIDPSYYFFNADSPREKIRLFNEKLINSKETHKMLMGYARIITDLSLLAKQGTLDENDFYLLFRSKLAYQDLKINYFEGKKAIGGFLKIATDSAESEMVQSAEIIQRLLEKPTYLERISDLITKNEGIDYATQIIERSIKSGNSVLSFTLTSIPGFASLGAKIQVDMVTGVIYQNGRQQINLPPKLQNHPDTRFLQIHTFPYTWDTSENAYIYYTKENGKNIPQVLVKEVGDDTPPVIKKRLSVGSRELLLQFVPKEQIKFPKVALHRMGIKNFWQKAEGELLGYDTKGNLVATFKKDNKSESYVITTPQGIRYRFLKQESLSSYKSHPVLSRLLSVFSSEEILIEEKGKEFFVPAISLTIKEEQTPESTRWVLELKGMTKKILDTSSEGSSSLIVKNDINSQELEGTRKELLETTVRLDLQLQKESSLSSKYNIRQLEKKIEMLQEKIATIEEKLFLSTLPENTDYLNETAILEMVPVSIRPSPRGLVNATEIFSSLLNFLRKNNSLNPFDPEILSSYLAVKETYEKECDTELEAVFFSKSINDTGLFTRNLSGALKITYMSFAKGSEAAIPAETLLIEELAKYPLDKSLKSSELLLLQRAIAALDNRIEPLEEYLQLSSYLNFMLYLHFSYKKREFATITLGDKVAERNSVERSFEETLENCTECISLLAPPFHLHKSLLDIWAKTNLCGPPTNSEILETEEASITQKEKPLVLKQMQFFSSQSLLERLFSVDIISSIHKEASSEISSEQKSLIRSFLIHSKDQVIGFYLEEMGHFNADGLYAEFKVNEETGKALYGLTKDDLKNIFTFLETKGYISKAGREANYYRLSSAEMATKQFEAAEIRAFLADKALSEEQLSKTTEKLRAFLYRAMQSGFKFSFSEGFEAELDKKLEIEKKLHLSQYLEAEAILHAGLSTHKVSWTELKYAVLSGDYGKFPIADAKSLSQLSQAMIRYLFHKTEVQHIENIQKAQAVGERNKIELLQTKRNYSIDLLLQENLPPQKKEEQIQQRAFLFFEEDYGNRCNLMQIRMFRSLMLGSDHEEAIDSGQARMGFGKTALLPLLVIVKLAIQRLYPEKERHLVRCVVTKAALDDNTRSFNGKLVSILGSKVVQDRDFPRYQIDRENQAASFKYILEDLESRLAFYTQIKKEGFILIQTPEIRNSMEAQDSDFGQMIIQAGEIDKANIPFCLEAKRLIGMMRGIPTYTIFDELDDTQDIKSREVNFTRGTKRNIPISSIRPLEKVISFVEKNKTKDWKDLRGRAKDLVESLCLTKRGESIIDCPKEVINYLTDRREPINPFVEDILSERLLSHKASSDAEHTENDSTLLLIRAMLLDDNILALMKSKQPNTHFGVRFKEEAGERTFFHDPDSESTLLIAVPYEGTNTPKGLSIFDNTEVAAITTMRYYLSEETLLSTKPHLDFLIKQIQKRQIPEALAKYYFKEEKDADGTPLLETLQTIAEMLDPEELKRAKEQFHDKFMKQPSEAFRKFFAMAVIVTQIRSDESCVKSDRYEKGSHKNIEKGFSGTVGGTSSYFAKQETDSAADGKLSIEIMGRENNAEIKWLSPPLAQEDYLESTIRTILSQANPNTRAIIDAAGICKSKDGVPETIIKNLWNQLKRDSTFEKIQGIIYYDKDNTKRLYKGPHTEAILCSAEMEIDAIKRGISYFSFYRQKNTRGSDIKQANKAHALITLDENVSNSDAKQAVLRFRNLVNRSSEQTFTFICMPEFKGIVTDALKAEGKKSLKLKTEEIIALQSKDKKTLLIEDKEAISALLIQWIKIALSIDLFTQDTPTEKITDVIKQNGIQISAKEVQNVIKVNTVSVIGRRDIKSKDIANFLRIQEKNLEEKNALIIFKKEMKAHVKQAASHLEFTVLSKIASPLSSYQQRAYIAFLHTRNEISTFVEESVNALYLKYGQHVSDLKRDEYILEQKRKAEENIRKLFDAANDFANSCNVTINEDLHPKFYIGHIDRSIKIFISRFDKDTPIPSPDVAHTDAQAVAEAIAEALAEAESASLAEMLSEEIIEVLERSKFPTLPMAENPPQDLSFSFLADQSTITTLPLKKDRIRQDVSSKFYMSPALKTNQEIDTHFFLSNGDNYIFISQEEADLFLKQIQEGSLKNPLKYVLFDARIPNRSISTTATTSIKSEIPYISSSILGDNDVPSSFPASTADLRALPPLKNVLTKQLLPRMSYQFSASYSKCFDPIKTFGLSASMTFQIAISSLDSEKIHIEIGSIAIDIPKNIIQFNKWMKEAFLTKQPSKITQVSQKAAQEEIRIKGLLEELELKIAEIKRVNAENETKIRTYTPFTIPSDQIKGIRVTEGPVGEETVKSIVRLQIIQDILKDTPSLENLQQLKQEFKNLVSEKTIEKFKDPNFKYKEELLFSADDWNGEMKTARVAVYGGLDESKNFESCPLIEQLYGQVVYLVHGADKVPLSRASNCGNSACRALFVNIIPDIIISIQRLSEIMEKVTAGEAEKREIEERIESLKRESAELTVSVAISKELEIKEKEVERALRATGLSFMPNTFFDQFIGFKELKDWNSTIEVAVEAVMPEYERIVNREMEAYKGKFTGLTVQEEEVLQRNKAFLRHIMDLSRITSNRAQEVAITQGYPLR